MGKGGSRRRLLADSLGVLPELAKEAVPETFWKKCSSGRNQRSSRRTLLPEHLFRKVSGRSSSFGRIPEEGFFRMTFEIFGRTFLKKWFFRYSGRTTSFGKFVCFFFLKKLFCFF